MLDADIHMCGAVPLSGRQFARSACRQTRAQTNGNAEQAVIASAAWSAVNAMPGLPVRAPQSAGCPCTDGRGTHSAIAVPAVLHSSAGRSRSLLPAHLPIQPKSASVTRKARSRGSRSAFCRCHRSRRCFLFETGFFLKTGPCSEPGDVFVVLPRAQSAAAVYLRLHAPDHGYQPTSEVQSQLRGTSVRTVEGR